MGEQLMSIRRTWLVLMSASALGLVACLDSIVRDFQPNNDLTIYNEPDSFRMQAQDLKNVNDRRVYTWRNNHSKLFMYHRGFIHHGYGLIVIRDAVGTVVDSTIMEWELNTQSAVGIPGDWTIDVTMNASRGRVDFSLQGVDSTADVPPVETDN
jgi:hypothetical protein